MRSTTYPPLAALVLLAAALGPVAVMFPVLAPVILLVLVLVAFAAAA